MHLHARRIRSDHPDGGKIDVTAELPQHFAESINDLAFDMSLGDLPLDEGKPEPTRKQLKQFAKAHAKQVRKEKRGERRSRGRKSSDTSRVGKECGSKCRSRWGESHYKKKKKQKH